MQQELLALQKDAGPRIAARGRRLGEINATFKAAMTAVRKFSAN